MKDLTGQRFGRLIALKPTEERRNGLIMWECKCDCGNLKLVRGPELVQGKTRSCGCLKKESASKNGKRTSRDITGERFGRLTAIRPTEKRLHNAVVWECVCDCGNTTFVSLGNLNGGSTRSCGCLHQAVMAQAGARKMNDLTGQRFGRLMAIRPTEQRSNGNIVWECLCDCGSTAFVSSSDLTRGNTKSCGCLQKEKAADIAKKRISDLTGQKFGRLLVVCATDERKNEKVVWECKCDCGNTVYIIGTTLKNGNTASCGCLRKRKRTKRE